MSTTVNNPLLDPPPAEVHLAKAPLEWVIALVRFPMVMEIERPEFLATFQASLRAKYPIGITETVQDLAITTPAPPPKRVWRFSDEQGSRVSLAQDFIALETRSYQSRSDFIARFREVLEAIPAAGRPPRADQLGVRYVDRLRGDALRDIATLVRPEIAGIASTEARRGCRHAFSDNSFQVGDDVLVARWGLLPKATTIDPAVMEPLPEPSWLLDLDMVSQQPMPFEPAAIAERAQAFATRIYTFFRWAITPEFLTRFGGTP